MQITQTMCDCIIFSGRGLLFIMVIRLNGTKHKPYVKKEEGGGGVVIPTTLPGKLKRY